MNKKLKLIFTISLLLNVLLIGMLAGQGSKRHFGTHRHQGPHQQLEEFVAGLPEQEQILFSKRLEEVKQQNQETRQQIRNLRSETSKLLEAETFDAEAYDALTSEISSLYQDMGTAQAGLMKELAMKLPKEKRKKLSESLGKRWGKDRKD